MHRRQNNPTIFYRAEKQQIRVELAQIREDLNAIRSERNLKNTALEQQLVPMLNESYNLNCCSSEEKKNCNIHVPSYKADPFEVPCEDGWIVVIRRIDGSVLFQRDWKAYKNGFGEVDGEYFIGLDKLHALTEKRSMELLFTLEDYEGVVKSERYERFAIGNEEEQYILHTMGAASGTAGDSFRYHYGMKFTTFDRDNDLSVNNCAEIRSGGWWYNKCEER